MYIYIYVCVYIINVYTCDINTYIHICRCAAALAHA